MADEEDAGGYRWETEYERTWEQIQENEEGLLQPSVEEIVHRTKRRRLLEKKNVRLGMMRHLYVVIDFSQAMNDQDLRPTRLICTLKLLESFVEEFYDQNPISQMGLITTKNKRADKLTELGGNPQRHISALKRLSDMLPSGEPSLQNALELAAQTLKHMPSHTSREVLIVLGSLTTCDPGDIYSTIDMLKSHGICCSVIGLAAEICVCRALTKATKGAYDVILDDHHFKELLYQHVTPPPATASTESSLIRMGFPHHQSEGEGKPSMCNCHLDSKNCSEGFGTGGYYCPQCHGKYCELPVECKACGLTLVSAPHLARSFHHLFPLDNFKEITYAERKDRDIRYCYSCQADFKEQIVYQCGSCSRFFCVDCDIFVHDTLHTCPGCSSNRIPEISL